MLNKEQKIQFNDILEEIGRNLDITQTQYEAAVKSYQAVGLHLAKEDSLLGRYDPKILPQGSFLLGTMTKPIHEDDELDIDLVCQLTGKAIHWSQFNLKQIVGDQLKAHGTYRRMLRTPDGRRCWTLGYAEEAKFHMDILPAIVDQGYRLMLERFFSQKNLSEANQVALRITDKTTDGYKTETNHLNWMKSNPFGYGYWFFDRASISQERKFSALLESIKPVPEYQKTKLPLQRVVQILKRHRDIAFEGSEDKPISIIITTLASHAYNKETDVIDALVNVVNRMELFIEDRIIGGKTVKWISNPVNTEENFADKWVAHPQRQVNFYRWLVAVKQDIQTITQQRGLQTIRETFSRSLGREPVDRAFSGIAEKSRMLTEQGANKIDVKTGIGSAGSIAIKKHTFYGK